LTVVVLLFSGVFYIFGALGRQIYVTQSGHIPCHRFIAPHTNEQNWLASVQCVK